MLYNKSMQQIFTDNASGYKSPGIGLDDAFDFLSEEAHWLFRKVLHKNDELTLNWFQLT